MSIEDSHSIRGQREYVTTGLLGRLQPLLKISEEIDTAGVVRALLAASIELAGAEYAALLRFQGSKPTIAIEARWNESALLWGEITKPLSASLAFVDQAIRSARPKLVEDPAEIASLLKGRPERRLPIQVLGIPSRVDDNLTLVLYLEVCAREHTADATSIEVLNLFLNQGAISFRHALQLEKITIENRKRIETEEKLLAAQTSLLKAQRIGQMGHFRWNVRTGVSRASDECYRLFGIEPAASVPYSTWADRVHPEDFPAVELELFRAANAHANFQAEYRAIRPDGEIRYLRAEGHPEVLPDGDVEYDGIILDVTDRRLVEQRFLQLQKELAAGMRLSALGELAGSIAHEIKQPLAAVVTAAEASLHWLSRDPPNLTEARTALSRLTSDGRRATAVVASIQSLAREHQKAFHPFDINDAIREVISIERTEIEQAGTNIVLELVERPLYLDGDRLQLQLVVINLVRNALEAMSELDRGTKVITITTTQVATGDVHVSVADRGGGFDEADIERMFDPLFTTKPYGMGMGLSICRTIMEAHDGRMWVTKNLPRGSVFHLQLAISSTRKAGSTAEAVGSERR
jgi:signal transduction histidine kinase